MVHRLKITIQGAVQGVGFRPFVYRLAEALKLPGYVLNSSRGVFIEVEGKKQLLDRFLLKIQQDKPSIAIIHSLEFSFLDPIGYQQFEIRKSDKSEEKTAFILPDIAVCPDCLRELNDSTDRRFRYPFINCTNCGPRFTIIEKLPYDRPNTSMKIFPMCPECRREYEDPANRRFHAQPVACPVCGPQIQLWDKGGKILAEKDLALIQTAEKIRAGKIIALKGLGGFQLICEARNNTAVQRLRQRKKREEKPFAVMFKNLQQLQESCIADALTKRILTSPESPIVFIQKKDGQSLVADAVAPANPYFGAMLPYTPLHHLLLMELNVPLVATSANLSEEPMIYREDDALKKLSGITDFYLVHNRPIVRQVDDSIVRIIQGREMVMRRARGFAPLPITVNSRNSGELYAAGGQLKNTVSIKKADQVFVSQHIGDLSGEAALDAFNNISKDLISLYEIKEPVAICDKHPDYLSTQMSLNKFKPVHQIQHHIAHIAACKAENQVEGGALGVSWDGTGWGDDGTIWGGEFFICDDAKIMRCASFRKFLLPGGEKAIREPRRTAFGMLYESNKETINEHDIKSFFTEQEFKVLLQMLEKRINCPQTTSCGRLFDGVASLLNIRQILNFEGQAAMQLEFISDTTETSNYPFEINKSEILTINWIPMVRQIEEDYRAGISVSLIARRFHNTLAQIILKIAIETNQDRVILSGGCFQNKILLEETIRLLQDNKIKVYWHQRIPTNDGGISVGQIAAYLYWYQKQKGE